MSSTLSPLIHIQDQNAGFFNRLRFLYGEITFLVSIKLFRSLPSKEWCLCHLLESENYAARWESRGRDCTGRNSINFLAGQDVQQGVKYKQLCFIKGLRNSTQQLVVLDCVATSLTEDGGRQKTSLISY